MIIQIVLIFLMAVIVAYTLKNRNTVRLRAGRKILLLSFALVGIVSIAHPQLLNDLARMVGVGRGADLLLYLLILAFIFYALNVYLKFKEYDARLVKLSREIALTEAKARKQK